MGQSVLGEIPLERISKLPTVNLLNCRVSADVLVCKILYRALRHDDRDQVDNLLPPAASCCLLLPPGCLLLPPFLFLVFVTSCFLSIAPSARSHFPF
eukprot:760797-Hanusia_phi.AAC.1